MSMLGKLSLPDSACAVRSVWYLQTMATICVSLHPEKMVCVSSLVETWAASNGLTDIAEVLGDEMQTNISEGKV